LKKSRKKRTQKMQIKPLIKIKAKQIRVWIKV